MPYQRSTASAISEVFSLNPLPYPVLLIFAVISIFLGLKWYVSYESVVEATEDTMGWLLMLAPLVLLFAVKWLSTFESSDWWFSGWGTQRRTYYAPSSSSTEGGGSPWGVAALIVLLLVLVQYQSAFLDSWFI